MSKLIVVDASGKYLRDLSGSIKVGEVIGVESEGPVTFVSGTVMRREQNPPFFISGDNGSIPNSWTPVAGSTIRVQAIAGPTQDLLDMTVQVEPAVTALTRIQLPADQTGDGKVNQDLKDTHLINFEQSMVYNDGKDHTVDNCISDTPFTRNRPGALFKGQPAYVEAIVKDTATGKLRAKDVKNGIVPPKYPAVPTVITFRRTAFLDGGYNPNLNNLVPPPNPRANPHWKDMFHHTGYINEYGQVVYYRCIFANPASCGCKVMRDGLFDECVFLHCSIGAQILYKPSLFRNCMFYRSSYYFDPNSNPGRDMGNLGMDIYAPLNMEDSDFIGGPATTWCDPLENPLNLGLFKFNKSHNQYTDTPGGSPATTKLARCRAYNWIRSSDDQHPYFSGDGWTGGMNQTLQGLTIVNDKTRPITYDEQKVIADVRAYRISIEDACLKIRGDLLKLVA